jgi:hypothetical protein
MTRRDQKRTTKTGRLRMATDHFVVDDLGNAVRLLGFAAFSKESNRFERGIDLFQCLLTEI